MAISDLHLTDEQTAINVPPGAFDILEHEILANAAEGEAHKIHLVLLGDIFDLVRTDYWKLKGRDGTLPVAKRPWNGTLSPATAMNADPGVERTVTGVSQAHYPGRRSGWPRGDDPAPPAPRRGCPCGSPT